MSLVVIEPGPLTLVQGASRSCAGMGVSPSGPFDRRALAHANALVGNAATAAGLEVLGGGLRLRAESRLTAAVTGASGPITVGGEPMATGRAFVIPAGGELTVGAFTEGLRGYVAFGGGLAVDDVLGSPSTDTLGLIGPAALAAGDRLPAGAGVPIPDLEDIPQLLTDGDLTVAAALGPRDDWFTPESVAALFTTAWQVSAESSRIGIRLAGAPLTRAVSGELASEPVVRGSVQVTSAGLPVILGPDHPVTGGYPVIAVVSDADCDRLGQARPGQTIRFRRAPL